MTDKLLTPEEVAERLVLSPNTIRTWLRTGKIKGIKAGRLWRIKESDLQEFLTPAVHEDESTDQLPLWRQK